MSIGPGRCMASAGADGLLGKGRWLWGRRSGHLRGGWGSRVLARRLPRLLLGAPRRAALREHHRRARRIRGHHLGPPTRRRGAARPRLPRRRRLRHAQRTVHNSGPRRVRLPLQPARSRTLRHRRLHHHRRHRHRRRHRRLPPHRPQRQRPRRTAPRLRPRNPQTSLRRNPPPIAPPPGSSVTTAADRASRPAARNMKLPVFHAGCLVWSGVGEEGCVDGAGLLRGESGGEVFVVDVEFPMQVDAIVEGVRNSLQPGRCRGNGPARLAECARGPR